MRWTADPTQGRAERGRSRPLRGLATASTVTFAVVVVACSQSSQPSWCTDGANDPPPSVQGTWQIDCVALLGIPKPSELTPLAAVPYTGLPRASTIGSLSDAQLGILCDFDTCLTMGGYRHDVCTDKACPPPQPGFPPAGSFQLETVPIIADLMETWFPTTYCTSPSPSRQSCIQELLNTFAGCHVGLWEDCSRTLAVGQSSTTCTERNLLCNTSP